GIKGALVLCGHGEVAAEAVEQFVNLAGGSKARVVVLRTSKVASPTENTLKQRLRERLEALKAPAFQELGFDPPDKDRPLAQDELSQATGIWLADGDPDQIYRSLVGTPLERACRSLLNRGGVLGLTAGSRLAGRVVPTAGNDDDPNVAGCDFLP